MCGKLRERNDRTMTEIITEPKRLYDFLAMPGIEVTNLVYDSDCVVWLSWKVGAEKDVPNLRHSNEVIGAYVTVGARQHLYTYLDMLQQSVLYCDTDTVLYIQPRDQSALVVTGENVGAMTSELKPKNFAYKIFDSATNERNTVCKIRGITLNYNPA